MPVSSIRITLVLCVVAFTTRAQNLVPNGGFEQYTSCPAESARLDLLGHWTSASEATPDLLCECASENSLVNTGLNFAGRQVPHSGRCYAGLLAWHSDEYYEYLEVKLESALVKNKTYVLRFFYTLSDFSDRQVPQLGAHFAVQQLKVHGQPQLAETHRSDSIQNNIRIWKEFSVRYTARGNEQYLVLGCFTTGTERAYGDTPPEGYGPRDGDHFAYYYIDDVSLTEFTGNETANKKQTGKIVEVPGTADKPVSSSASLKKDFASKNIYFPTNQSSISSLYFPYLKKLAAYILAHPESRLTITGHTDNRGNDSINIPLGMARAFAVRDYLIRQGVDKKRMTCLGHSSRQPAKPNTNEANRQKNRRVELTLVLD